jgi:hypothetical protein
MPISMLDHMCFELSCGHPVVLGRLAAAKNWACEGCKAKWKDSSAVLMEHGVIRPHREARRDKSRNLNRWRLNSVSWTRSTGIRICRRR